jgi:PII-like signaling protein
MRPNDTVLQLTIFVEECDTWKHRPLVAEIVHRAHQAGLAGASVFRGVGGFGASTVIHAFRLLSIKQELPLAIVIVDEEERIRRFRPTLKELVTEGLVIVEEVEVVRVGQAHADAA